MGNALRLAISKIGLAWTKRRMKTSIKRNAISLLILGTQATGKTTIALRLWKYKKALPDLNYVQTKGFNSYTIVRKNKGAVNLYDLGGHPSIQELWDHYYADAHGVIFVVDISKQEELPGAGKLFSQVLNDHRIRGKPILLLANKQDLGGASELELDNVMNLQETVNSARCLTRLDESTATDLKNDKGIFEGFRWLVTHVENHFHELNDRVMHDVMEERNREKARRAALTEQTEQMQASVGETELLKDEAATASNRSQPSGTQTPKSHSTSAQPNNIVNPASYLIRSRPSSSSRDTFRRFFDSATSNSTPSGVARRPRRSLPSIHLSRDVAKAFLVRQAVDESPTIQESLVDQSPAKSRSSSGPSANARLSPEGADSDEGVVNSGFEADALIPSFPAVEVGDNDNCSRSLGHFQNEDKVLKRTESSDTERGDILLVTTLVQVHENKVSKDRRGSTTSTQNSVALSITSLKSEDANNSSQQDETQENFSSLPIATKPAEKRIRGRRNKTAPAKPQLMVSTIHRDYKFGNVTHKSEPGETELAIPKLISKQSLRSVSRNSRETDVGRLGGENAKPLAKLPKY